MPLHRVSDRAVDAAKDADDATEADVEPGATPAVEPEPADEEHAVAPEPSVDVAAPVVEDAPKNAAAPTHSLPMGVVVK